MPDIHDMELDARPSDQELYGNKTMTAVAMLLSGENTDCKHENREYQPFESDTNVSESYHCVDCGKELEIPEPNEDTMRGEDR